MNNFLIAGLFIYFFIHCKISKQQNFLAHINMTPAFESLEWQAFYSWFPRFFILFEMLPLSIYCHCQLVKRFLFLMWIIVVKRLFIQIPREIQITRKGISLIRPIEYMFSFCALKCSILNADDAAWFSTRIVNLWHEWSQK